MQKETLPAQATIIGIGPLATALDDPGAVRLADNAGDLHPSRCEIDDEQDREARQPTSGPHLHREEIRGGEDVSMRAEKLLPSRPLLALRLGFNPMLPQDGGDGPSADVMIEVGKRALDAGIAP